MCSFILPQITRIVRIFLIDLDLCGDWGVACGGPFSHGGQGFVRMTSLRILIVVPRLALGMTCGNTCGVACGGPSFVRMTSLGV
ncbi:hypothetical protein ACI6PS_16025 [Flavobacterium sp. PLA-1-15]|uniref:hypothetical protein n=1 Tax=Flavobacterium sp. PLA-1-15 TaxID=3380533 RepID=UPI003B75F59E